MGACPRHQGLELYHAQRTLLTPDHSQVLRHHALGRGDRDQRPGITATNVSEAPGGRAPTCSRTRPESIGKQVRSENCHRECDARDRESEWMRSAACPECRAYVGCPRQTETDADEQRDTAPLLETTAACQLGNAQRFQCKGVRRKCKYVDHAVLREMR